MRICIPGNIMGLHSKDCSVHWRAFVYLWTQHLYCTLHITGEWYAVLQSNLMGENWSWLPIREPLMRSF